jgi:hypothetical protein
MTARTPAPFAVGALDTALLPFGQSCMLPASAYTSDAHVRVGAAAPVRADLDLVSAAPTSPGDLRATAVPRSVR